MNTRRDAHEPSAAVPADADWMNHRAWAWAALAAVLIGTVVRFAFLDLAEGYIRWADEATHLLGGLRVGAEGRPWGQNHSTVIYWLVFLGDALYYLGLRATGGVSSGTEFAARFFVEPAPYIAVARTIIILTTAAGLGAAYLLGTAVAGRAVGAVTTLVLTVNVLFTNLAVYTKEDMPLTAAATMCVWMAVRWMQAPSRRRLVGAGAWAGVTAAVKFTGGMVLLAPLLAVLLTRGGAAKVLQRMAVAAVASFVAFAVLNPFAVMDPRSVVDALGGLSEGHLGPFAAPAPALTFYLGLHLPNLVSWAGVLLMLLGLGLLAVRSGRTTAVLLAFPVATVGLMGLRSWHNIAHYLTPVVPMLVVGMAVAVVLPWAFRSDLRGRSVAVATAILLVGSMVHQVRDTVGYLTIASAPDTRDRARAWVLAEVPPGDTVTVEGDFFGLPVWGILLPMDETFAAEDPWASELEPGSAVRALQVAGAALEPGGYAVRQAYEVTPELLARPGGWVVRVDYAQDTIPERVPPPGPTRDPAVERCFETAFDVVEDLRPNVPMTSFWPSMTSADFDRFREVRPGDSILTGPRIRIYRRTAPAAEGCPDGSPEAPAA